jgi:hypothetical protein
MSYSLPATVASAWRAPERSSPRWRRLRRAVWTAAGLLLMLAGFVAVVVPGHLTFAAAGLVIVLRNSARARRMFVKLQRSQPNWVRPLRRLLRRRPRAGRREFA